MDVCSGCVVGDDGGCFAGGGVFETNLLAAVAMGQQRVVGGGAALCAPEASDGVWQRQRRQQKEDEDEDEDEEGKQEVGQSQHRQEDGALTVRESLATLTTTGLGRLDCGDILVY